MLSEENQEKQGAFYRDELEAVEDWLHVVWNTCAEVSKKIDYESVKSRLQVIQVTVEDCVVLRKVLQEHCRDPQVLHASLLNIERTVTSCAVTNRLEDVLPRSVLRKEQEVGCSVYSHSTLSPAEDQTSLEAKGIQDTERPEKAFDKNKGGTLNSTNNTSAVRKTDHPNMPLTGGISRRPRKLFATDLSTIWEDIPAEQEAKSGPVEMISSYANSHTGVSCGVIDESAQFSLLKKPVLPPILNSRYGNPCETQGSQEKLTSQVRTSRNGNKPKADWCRNSVLLPIEKPSREREENEFQELFSQKEVKPKRKKGSLLSRAWRCFKRCFCLTNRVEPE